MKQIFLILAGLLALFGAQAQTISYIPVHVVVSPSAGYQIRNTRNTTVPNFVTNDVINRTNQIFTASNIPVQITDAGYTESVSVCCGSQTGWGDMAWVRNSIPIQQARDNNNAGITLVITDFDPIYEPMSPASCAVGGGNSPYGSVSGVSIGAQAGGRDMIALAIAQVLCADANGMVYRRGPNAGDCEAALTVELANTPFNGGVPITVTGPDWADATGTCHAASPSPALMQCSAAAQHHVPSSQLTGCTVDTANATNATGHCTYSVNGNTLNTAASVVGTATTTFNCTNITRLFYFSNPNISYKTVPMGDSAYNNAAKISAQGLQTKSFHLVKTSGKPKAPSCWLLCK